MRRLAVTSTLVALAALCHAEPGGAQNVTTSSDSNAHRAALPPMPRPANDSIFRRARRLVSEGKGAAGRALVDSILKATPEGTTAYGDALYWQGALAETAADAERAYRRVIVEYPISTYNDDALLAIAELEQARGDRAGALAHLQRFVREHPSSPGRAVAALAAGRLAFEQRDTRTACAMMTEARASVSNTDVELRNQIEYFNSRCPAQPTAVASAAPADLPAPVPVDTPAAKPALVPAPVPAPAPAPKSVAKPAAAKAAAKVAEKVAEKAPAKAVKAAASESSSAMTLRRDSVSNRTAPTKAATKAPAASSARESYTIQLAAYNTRADADRLVAKLAARGVKARVSGNAKPFRVRLDFYKTRQAAANEVAALKARGIIGFVTTEPTPEGKTP
jgi:cell division septation protein DedD